VEVVVGEAEVQITHVDSGFGRHQTSAALPGLAGRAIIVEHGNNQPQVLMI